MKNIILTSILIFQLPAFAGVQEGVDAYRNEKYEIAYKELKPLAENGDAVAQLFMSYLYADGIAVPADQSESLKWLMLSVQQGYVEALTSLGSKYLYGWNGLTKDVKKGIELYKKAAENGDSGAEVTLGAMYINGGDVPRDYEESKQWYLKAAMHGEAQAQYHIGGLYDGQSIAIHRMIHPDDKNAYIENYVQAAKWYRLAADQGHVAAQVRLGDLYLYGLGVPQSGYQAQTWYKKVSDKNSDAQFKLCQMFYKGEGVQEDLSAAYDWCLKAAMGRHKTAQVYVAIMLMNGEGIKEDDINAYAWLNLVAAHGEKIVIELKEKLSKGMSTKQIEQAEELSQEYYEKYRSRF
jgi:hypothetical protein